MGTSHLISGPTHWFEKRRSLETLNKQTIWSDQFDLLDADHLSLNRGSFRVNIYSLILTFLNLLFYFLLTVSSQIHCSPSARSLLPLFHLSSLSLSSAVASSSTCAQCKLTTRLSLNRSGAPPKLVCSFRNSQTLQTPGEETNCGEASRAIIRDWGCSPTWIRYHASVTFAFWSLLTWCLRKSYEISN